MSELASLAQPASLQHLSPPEWRRVLYLVACFEALPDGAERRIWVARLVHEKPTEAALLAQFCAAHCRATASAFLRQPAATAASAQDYLDTMLRVLRRNV